MTGKYRDEKGRFVEGHPGFNDKPNSRSFKEGHTPWNKRKWNYEGRPETGYVLGVLLGDGCVCKEYGIIVLSVKDREFAERFKESLEEIGMGVPEIRERETGTGHRHIVRRGCKEFSDWFHSMNHQEMYSLLDTREMLLQFVAGLFDSEGSVGVHEESYSYNIRYVTTSKEALNLFLKATEELGYEFRYYKDKSSPKEGTELKRYCAYLVAENQPLQKKEVAKAFLRDVNPSIPRRRAEVIG